MIKLGKILEAKKMMAKDLAEEINVAPSTMSLYINGKREPDYQTLVKIADCLEITLDELFGRVVIPKEAKILNRVQQVRLYLQFAPNVLSEMIDVSLQLFEKWERNEKTIPREYAELIANLCNGLIDANFILGARYQIKIPEYMWTDEQKESFNFCPEKQDVLRFIFGKGECVELDEMQPIVVTSQEEKLLINRFRNSDIDGKADMTREVRRIYEQQRQSAALFKNKNNVG